MSEEINNINLNLGSDEKFALICGMLAGLRLGNKYSANKIIVTLYPIGVGGYGTIGLMASDVEYTGINSIRVPVVTHDVDIDYSGFALHLKYDTSKMTITSIESGDFGTIDHTWINNGEAYTMCMLPSGETKKEPMIMCWLNINIISPPTKNNPIKIDFINSTGYNPNDCCLLQWVLKEDGNYYSFFITPTINNGFSIFSNEEDIQTQNENVAEETEVAAPASPSMIALGTSFIYPGTSGCIPIYLNSNYDDAFTYNGFNLKVRIENSKLENLSLEQVMEHGEWELIYSIEHNESNDLIINISGHRDTASEGTSTPGALIFKLEEGVGSFSAVIHNELSELVDDNTILGVTGYPGYIYYSSSSQPTPGSDYPPWPDNRGGGTDGGMTGGGSVWSSTAQVMWVTIGSISYPVYLNPGWNNVYLYIPFIFPEPTIQEIQIVIESQGYLLIPGGFEWNIDIPKGAPTGISSPHIIDRMEIKDIYDIELIHVEPPVDIDAITDEFEIIDTSTNTLTNIIKKVAEALEELDIVDVNDVELIHPIKPITADSIIDEFNIEDIDDEKLRTINRVISDVLDEFNIEDINDIELIHPVIPVTADSIIDDIETEDMYNLVMNNITNKDDEETENISIDDIADVELN